MPGRHFLQIPGPSNVPLRVLRAIEQPTINHRGEAFAELARALFPDLQRVFRTQSGTPLVFPASGTGGWESALLNTLSPGDAVLAPVIGAFSAGWADAAANLGFTVERMELPWGGTVPPDEIEARLRADGGHAIKAVLLIHNETATGVTADVAAVREAMNRAGHPALLLVDTISGLGCTDFRFDDWGVDVAVAGSQKGLLLPPGLALLCVSERALAARERAMSPRHYFDWGAMLALNPKGIFPYTPATNLLYGLREALTMLFDEGMERVFARHARMARGVREAVTAWGLKPVATSEAWASPVLTAVRLPEGADGQAVLSLGEREFELSLGNGLGPLAGKVFRIGHLGDINDLEILATLAGCELILRRIGVEVTFGSGVAAYQQFAHENPAAALGG